MMSILKTNMDQFLFITPLTLLMKILPKSLDIKNMSFDMIWYLKEIQELKDSINS